MNSNGNLDSQAPILKHPDLLELLEDLKSPVERRMLGATSGHTSLTAWRRILGLIFFKTNDLQESGVGVFGFFRFDLKSLGCFCF